MIDIQNDTELKLLKESLHGGVPGMVIKVIRKTPIDIDYNDLTDEAFADKAHRQLPIFSPGHAAMSALYLMKQREHSSHESMERCKNALIALKLREIADMLECSSDVEELEALPKVASVENDVEFILRSSNKLPVADSDMLSKSASIFLSNIDTLTLKEKLEGSANLVKIASKYGKEIDDSRVQAYTMNRDVHLVKVATSLLERIAVTGDESYRDIYSEVTAYANNNGQIMKTAVASRDLAGKIFDLDSKNNVVDKFDVMRDVYNTDRAKDIEKVASDTFAIGEREVNIDKLKSLTGESLSDLLGENVEASDFTEHELITKVAEHIESLPLSAQIDAVDYINGMQ